MDDLGERLRRVLRSFAAATFPADDGLDRIRSRTAQPHRPWWQRAITRVRAIDRWITAGFASLTLAPRRTRSSGAPGQGGAAHEDDDLGSSTS